MLICKDCLSGFEKLANSGRCRDCYNAFMADYMTARYHRRRAAGIVQLGGRCRRCGSTNDLEFDRVDRDTKSFDMAKILSGGSELKVATELAKCQLLCSDCHRGKSRNEATVGHGGGVSGVKNCRCEQCAPLKRAYAREWRSRNMRR